MSVGSHCCGNLRFGRELQQLLDIKKAFFRCGNLRFGRELQLTVLWLFFLRSCGNLRFGRELQLAHSNSVVQVVVETCVLVGNYNE